MAYIAFPHQISNIEKLEGALAFVGRLIDEGQDISDDGVLGYGLVRAGLYRFRGQVTDLEGRIAVERRKPQSTQGPRTAARDVRRTFLLLGMIRRTRSGWILTDRARRILAAVAGHGDTAAKRDEWIAALVNLKFQAATDEPGVNEGARVRPLRIMLEMLATMPQPTSNLAVAFAAQSESDQELGEMRKKVKALAAGDIDWASAIALAGASESLARDNVKILPSLADQLGLISRRPEARLTGLGILALEKMRSAKPVWVADLAAGEPRQTAACALLVALQMEDVSKGGALSLISSTGVSVEDALGCLSAAGLVVEERDGVFHLVSDVSFDPYQDAPDGMFAHPAYQAALTRVSGSLDLARARTPTAAGAVPRRRHIARIKPLRDLVVSIPEPDDREEAIPLGYEELVAKRQQAIVARERRQSGHERIVNLVADYYRERYVVEPRCTQLYDLFLLPSKALFVGHEMKTITPEDERSQIMTAVGQLLYYQYFEARYLTDKHARIINVVAVDSPLTDEAHTEFLASLGIGLIWADGDSLHFEGAAAEMLSQLPSS